MQSLRVVVPTLEVGGAEKHLSYILPLLAKKYNFKIKVITLTSSVPLADTLKKYGICVKIPTLSLRRPWNHAFNFFRLLWDFLIDRHSITHFFLPGAYLSGMPCRFFARNKAPCLMSRRSLNLYQKKKVFGSYTYRDLESFLHPFLTLALGNSSAVTQQLINDENIPNHKVKLIYNGIDFQRFENIKKTPSDDILGNTVVLIIIANLIPYKGHLDLFSALNLCKHEIKPNWKLLCVGRDFVQHKSKLLKTLKTYNLLPDIEFIENINDSATILPKAHIGLLSSHEEGFSNAILEKMAAGLPVIATNVGGNAEAIIDGETGFIVPPKDPAALSQAILKLINSPSLIKTMGNRSKERIKECFSLEKCAENYANLYHSLSS